MSVRTRRTRSGIRTAIAIVLLAFMLFPVYWMLNISLQSTGGTLASSFFPTQPSLDGYRTAIADQGGNLVTSITIAIGTVALTCWSPRRRRTRWPSSVSAGSTGPCWGS